MYWVLTKCQLLWAFTYVIFLILTTTLRSRFHYSSHVTNEKTEAQEGKVTYPRTHQMTSVWLLWLPFPSGLELYTECCVFLSGIYMPFWLCCLFCPEWLGPSFSTLHPYLRTFSSLSLSRNAISSKKWISQVEIKCHSWMFIYSPYSPMGACLVLC